MKYAGLQPDIQVGNYLYNHQALLGSGTYGKVYFGRNLKNEPVAIKIIDKSNIKDEYSLKSLMNEIQTMMSINSPNVVRCYDYLVEMLIA